MGRPSVFVINSVLTIGTSLIVVVYVLFFAKICVSFAENMNPITTSYAGEVFKQKYFYCLFLYIVLFPNIIKKNISELKAASYILFAAIISLVSFYYLYLMYLM
jgi:hypothetical protein